MLCKPTDVSHLVVKLHSMYICRLVLLTPHACSPAIDGSVLIVVVRWRSGTTYSSRISPRLWTMNDEITKATSDHKRRQWREFVESIDHRTDITKLWRTIKGIDGKSKQRAENEDITFTGGSHTSPKLIANSFNRHFTTSKLGKHSSSRRTRHVSKDVKRMSLDQAESFTSDQVTCAIKSCRSSRAYGPDTLSIFHLKNLGPLATGHLTAHYNDSLKSCRLPSIWKTSLVIPIPKPGKDSSQGTSYRPISLLCPAAKVLEALI